LKQRPSLALYEWPEKAHPFASAFSGIDVIVTATTPTRPIAATIAKIVNILVSIERKRSII
jgi:Asp-tRNA(Asn)/Glu-tRNA(Gln) amidotransferase A subunit family amidase